MKFNVQSKLLLNRLNAVSKVISSKNAYAILDNFLFELTPDRLIVTGSDMETRLTTSIEVQDVEGAGKFAIDVKRTINSLKELPDTALTFDINDENLAVHVTYLNGFYDAMALNGDEYPEKAANASDQHTFDLPARNIALGISHTIFAVGNDDMHPQFTGIYWDIKPDMIVFVASDSHKLVRYRQTNITPNFERSFILPAKPAAILNSIVDHNSDDPVTITVDDNSATFEGKDFTLSCRFINGRYPNYNSVIPENNPYTMSADRMELLNAVRRVAVFANVGGLVRLDLSADHVLLTAQDVERATSAEETIKCEYDGEPMKIGFKSADIIDVVGNIDCDQVNLKLLDPARAGVFVPAEQNPGEELLVLQMPMMV